MSARGLFFDFDGTLVDSVHSLKDAYFDFLKNNKRKGSDEEFDSLNGPPLDEIVRKLKNIHHLLEEEEELLSSYIKQLSHVYQQVTPTEGAEKLLKTAQENGWKCAVVTSNSRAVVESWLKKQGLEKYFSLIIGIENGLPGKPAADPYLKALELLGCKAKDSYAIEDSQQGMMAARAAGIPTFLIKGNVKAERYNMTVQSLSEIIPYISK